MDETEKEKMFEQANAWVREAVSALKIGRHDRARELFLKVIEIAPGFADAYYNLGVICDMQKNSADALTYYTATLKYNPDHAQCLTNLGAIHSNAGRYASAVPFFLRAIKSDPNLFQPQINLGITYRHMEQPDKAMEALKGALTLEPENPYALYLAGCAAQESGFHTDAGRYLKSALRIRPNYTDALIVLVDVCLEMEDPEQAVGILEAFLKTNPDNEPAKDCLRRIRSAGLIGP